MESTFYQNTQFDDNDYVLKFKNRFERLDTMNSFLINHSNEEVVETGVGDYCSPVIIVLKDHSQDDILLIYKTILQNFDLKINDVFVTYLCKTRNNVLNLQAFKKEIEILKDGSVFLLHGFNARNMNCDSVFVDYNKYKEMIDITVNNTTAKMSEEYHKAKQEFSKTISNAFMYLNKVKNKK